MYTIWLSALSLILTTTVTRAQALSDAEVENLLVRIRENRITQADFQEEKVIRLMTKPILSSGRVSATKLLRNCSLKFVFNEESKKAKTTKRN
jgi:hypothetical protein